MKQYQKPALYALSLSANDMLCSGCNLTTRGSLPACIQDWLIDHGYDATYGLDDDGVLTWQEASQIGLFGIGEECGDNGIIGYCKFTANDGTIVFTS